MYLNIALDKMFNIRNVVINYFHEFIKNFSKDGISNIPTENVLALTQQMNYVWELLSQAKSLPHETPVYVLTGLTWCIVVVVVVVCSWSPGRKACPNFEAVWA